MRRLFYSLICIICSFSTYAFGSKLISTNPNEYSNLQDLKPHVLHIALRGYNYALGHGHVKRPMLGIADYTQSSVQKRFYIVDIKHKKVLAHFRVSHGANSGALYATKFSNQPGSHMTSLGVFITGKTYHGEYGYALRLEGIERGINDNAARRDVVVHGEWFLRPDVVHLHNEAGKSYGCFVVDPAKARQVIDYLKDGAVLFSYAPQEDSDPNL